MISVVTWRYTISIVGLNLLFVHLLEINLHEFQSTVHIILVYSTGAIGSILVLVGSYYVIKFWLLHRKFMRELDKFFS